MAARKAGNSGSAKSRLPIERGKTRTAPIAHQAFDARGWHAGKMGERGLEEPAITAQQSAEQQTGRELARGAQMRDELHGPDGAFCVVAAMMTWA